MKIWIIIQKLYMFFGFLKLAISKENGIFAKIFIQNGKIRFDSYR